MEFFRKKPVKDIPQNELRYLSLGGAGEVNKNMHVYEFDGQLIAIDCGIDFPDSDMPGVEIVIPDFTYVASRRDKFQAVFITHGHEDHYGALPYLLQDVKVPVYASRLVRGLILAKLEEFGLNKEADIRIMDPEKDTIQVGPFKVSPFRINHSVPDSCGLCIETPVGRIFHVADFKFDWTPVMDKPFDVKRALQLADPGVLSLYSDSLGAATGGFTRSERDIEDEFLSIFSKAQGQIFLSTISSNISRMQQAINVSLKLNRKVCFLGRSIERNAIVARSLGYLNLPKKAVIKMENAMDYPQNQITYIITGCYGQPNSALGKLARKEHRFIDLDSKSTVVFSADPAPPGAKEHVDTLVDKLTSFNADVYYYDTQENLHTSGHGSARDLLMLAALLKPKYFVPIGGTPRHAFAYTKLVAPLGVDPKNVFKLEAGQFLRYLPNGRALLGEKIHLTGIYLDTYGTEDPGGRVLRDRQMLASDGILVITVGLKEKSVPVRIEVNSRGFVPEKDTPHLPAHVDLAVKQFFSENPSVAKEDRGELYKRLRKVISGVVYKQTLRRPLILIVVLDIPNS